MGGRRNHPRHPKSVRHKSTKWIGTAPIHGSRIKCPSGKSGFTSQEAALARMEELRQHDATRGSNRSSSPVRVYECEMCDGWHFTSRPLWRAP